MAGVSVAVAPVDAAVAAVESPDAVPVAVALPPPESRSSPAVMVTGARLSDKSLKATVEVPGSFASGPASVSTQLAVWEAMAQPTSIVLGAKGRVSHVDGISCNVRGHAPAMVRK